MKKLLLILALVLCSSTFGQSLNIEGQYLKEKKPDQYEAIREYSENKWEDDHVMILHEINEQSKAFVGILKYLSKPPEGFEEVLIPALKKWSEGEITANLATNNTVDFKMVLYEVENQLKARKVY